MAIEIISAPSPEPVSVDELKLFMRMDAIEFDAMLEGFIIAGRYEAEKYQGRAFLTQTLKLWLDDWPKLPLCLPRAPLQSVGSVKYYDENDVEYTFDAENYFVDTKSEPGRIELASGAGLPSTTLRSINAVAIEFVCGYGEENDVPELTKTAIKVFATHRFENPDTDKVPDAFYYLLTTDKLDWF